MLFRSKRRNLHQVEHPSTPLSSTTRKWRSSSRASAKSSSKWGGKDYKSRSKKVCYKCGKPGHFIAKYPISSDSDRGDDKKGRKKEKKRYHKKKGGDALVCCEWDSDESSTDSSSDEDAANITINKGLLFPNVGHKCLMTKDGKRKKVKSKSSTKYESSSDGNAGAAPPSSNSNGGTGLHHGVLSVFCLVL